MTPEDIEMIRQVLPEDAAFPYYPDRESPWLLAQGIGAAARVAELKAGPRAALLGRPLVKPVVAASGGVVRQADLLAVAHADRALRLPDAGAGARAALEQVFAGPWQDYRVTLAAWGTGDVCWHYSQMSRKGGNLVLQLGFPSDHAVILGQLRQRVKRSDYEYTGHPVRRTGRPTLAWVRLDIDLETGTALIEEVQSDWVRWVAEDADYLTRTTPQTREAKNVRAYAAELSRTYAKAWPTVALFAALVMLVDELGVRTIWMHQPAAGAVLKDICGTHPPRSLYTQLPKRFGFCPVREAPPFLLRPRRTALARIGHFKSPLFWKLSL
ncbi:MAG: hypothetical protein AAGA87_11840 [Pseudomonadota bacterium]